MKSKILLMAVLIILAQPKLYAQANCTPIPDCIYNWGTNSSSTLSAAQLQGLDINSTSNTMLPDWSVFMGTPIYGPGMSSSTGIQMVSDATAGEGVYTCYNFRAGKSYKICLMAYNTTSNTSGNLILEAYNSTTGASQIIWNNTFYSSSYQEFPYTIVVPTTQSFNQLRIYTNSTAGSSPPYSVVFDDIGVTEIPVLSATLTTINGCGSTVLTANSTNPLFINWSPTTYLTPSSGAATSVTARPCQPTTVYTASYKSNGCWSGWNCVKEEHITINVVPGTTVTASPSMINRCQSSTLTASSLNSMAVTWSPSTGLSSTSGNVVTATPCKTTTYTASFRCLATGCTYTKPVTVFVNGNSTDSIVNKDTIPCMDTIRMHFSNPCPNIVSYLWIGPKGNVLSTTSSLLITNTDPTDQGDYMLVTTTLKGCKDTFKTKVVMLGCCDIKADFDVVGCNPIRFINTTTSGGSPVIAGEWYWDLGDGTSSTLRNPSHLYITKMGPAQVCMTVVYQGQSTCCDKICKDINICDFLPCDPKAAFDFQVMSPGHVQFMDKSAGSGPACAWQWKVNGSVVSSAQNPLLSLGPGTYTICLQVTYCPPHLPPCSEEWCEQVVIP